MSLRPSRHLSFKPARFPHGTVSLLMVRRMARVPTIAFLLALLVARAIRGYVADAAVPATQNPAGAQRLGFAVSLYAPDTTIRLGQPIRLVVEYRNITSGVLHADTVSANRFRFTVRRSESNAIVAPRPEPVVKGESFSSSASGFPIKPGEAIIRHLNLEDFVQINAPGTYSVQVTTAPIFLGNGSVGFLNPSNTITIIVTH